KLRYRRFGPDGPVAEQSTYDASLAAAEIELREQVGNDVVVVAGVERDFRGASGLYHCAHDIQRLIAVERRDFNSDDILDFRELAPKRVRQRPPAHAGLEVEADDWNRVCDGPRVRD